MDTQQQGVVSRVLLSLISSGIVHLGGIVLPAIAEKKPVENWSGSKVPIQDIKEVDNLTPFHVKQRSVLVKDSH